MEAISRRPFRRPQSRFRRSAHFQSCCSLLSLFHSSACRKTNNSERPSVAPKPVAPLKHIRENVEQYTKNCVDRRYAEYKDFPNRILELHEQLRQANKEVGPKRSIIKQIETELEKNARSRQEQKQGDITESVDLSSLRNQARTTRANVTKIENDINALESQISTLALSLPNLTSTATPIGTTPKLLEYLNNHPQEPNRIFRSHVDIGTRLNLFDFTSATSTAGWGWYYLLNSAALLEQALIQFALTTAIKRGWNPVSPPSIVYTYISDACGFNPRDHHGEQQVYTLQQDEKDSRKPGHSLAGTAEIPLAGMKANSILEASQLPLKVIGSSRCYRAEAGARGVDTKGLYRVHEFTKVEMFAWTLPSHADEGNPTFDELVDIQKEIYQALGLHCRVLEMPTSDLGASAYRKIDIEAWFPSRRAKDGGWGEVSSASICTDYQTRRLATRLKTKGIGEKLGYPHTINGTAIAVPRVLAAILENGWDEEGGFVWIPQCLRSWMGGKDRIGPDA